MNKSELVESIYQQLGEEAGSKASVERFLNTTLEAIAEGLKKEKAVNITGFGNFTVVHHDERQGINPATKQPITIAASNKVKFKAGKGLSEKMN